MDWKTTYILMLLKYYRKKMKEEAKMEKITDILTNGKIVIVISNDKKAIELLKRAIQLLKIEDDMYVDLVDKEMITINTSVVSVSSGIVLYAFSSVLYANGIQVNFNGEFCYNFWDFLDEMND